MKKIGLWALVALLPGVSPAQLRWGRDLADRPSAIIGGTIGNLVSLEGSVRETSRPFYDITEPEKNIQFAESYTLEELGFDGGYSTFGLTFEKAWRFFTFQGHFIYLNPSVSSQAIRDYYIGVEEVTFAGKEYDYLTIPKGTPFQADLEGGLLGMRGLVTPISLTLGPSLEITPSLCLGLQTFFSVFEIDAGPAQGVMLYEIPPREYVICGRGKGWNALALPELGISGELRWKGRQGRTRGPELALQGYVATLDFAGSTEDFGISSRNEKVLDVGYEHYEARVLVGLPAFRSADLILGAAFEQMEARAQALAKERSEEEIRARREKFNKDIRLDFSTVSVILGLRF